MSTKGRTQYDGMPLEEVAAALGLSRQRVRQIEVQALAKARALLERMGLQASDFLESIHQSPRR